MTGNLTAHPNKTEPPEQNATGARCVKGPDDSEGLAYSEALGKKPQLLGNTVKIALSDFCFLPQGTKKGMTALQVLQDENEQLLGLLASFLQIAFQDEAQETKATAIKDAVARLK